MKSTPALIALLLIIFCLSSCGVKRSSTTNNQSFDELENSILVQNATSAFPLPEVPESIKDNRQRAIYLSKNYWESFNFNDTSLISQVEITEQGFVDYIHILNYIPFNDAKKSQKNLFNQAKEHPKMYAHFASLFQKYYYDKDSPFRNEELYIPVLDIILKSKILSAGDKESYDFQREMIHKNRVGTKASDFVYTLPNGESNRMRAFKSDYLLLLFSHPNHSDCVSVRENINNSEILKKVFSHNSFNRNMLMVLNIYPGNDIMLWREELSSMSKENWINAYDKGMVITKERVFDIQDIPTIYLLDKNKRIILKDASLEEIESFFSTPQ
jgi:hypothetical protein